MVCRDWVRNIIAVLLGFGAAAAAASPRSIRIDFGGEWGNGASDYALGTAQCPGTTNANTLVLWNGFTFSGDSDPLLHFNTDTYCQLTAPFNPASPSNPYFSSASFFQGDEPVLAAMVGPNTNNAVTGIRFTYLGGPRFNNPNGFQWAFYFFPRKVTVVGLYGLTGITLNNTNSYIIGPVNNVWLGGSDGYDGQYFCFQDFGPVGSPDVQFIGSWNGTLTPASSACLKKIATMFVDGFEG